MLTFDQFKENGIARAIVNSLGPVAGADDQTTWLDVLDRAVSFDDFRRNVIARNGALRGMRHFVDAVDAASGAAMLSQAQFNLLCAFCCMVDFGHVADRLVEKRKVQGGVWAGIYASMDRPYAKVLATMIREAAVA
ncbi:hypothetical protein [Bradyrhizobium sp. Bra64]|uniref:hypothetical protein n=1 Tax=Bradyrhizobium sp. Bra64 TaxID=2926009 RepID=UPI002119724D|nr:hypothetical protein [Bradyrhizobium sp. Bra64]